MPAVGGVASVLGIKCVNLFSCACVYCFGEGGCDVQLDKDTNRGVEGDYWLILEVADLRFDFFFFFVKDFYREQRKWGSRM